MEWECIWKKYPLLRTGYYCTGYELYFMCELWVITYCTSCELQVIFLSNFVTDKIFVYNFAALLKNDNQEVILILETLLFVSDWKNDIFQNSSLESDKFLILLLIFLLLKIVKKKAYYRRFEFFSIFSRVVSSFPHLCKAIL